MSIIPILMLLSIFGPPMLALAYLARIAWCLVVGPAQAIDRIDNKGGY